MSATPHEAPVVDELVQTAPLEVPPRGASTRSAADAGALAPARYLLTERDDGARETFALPDGVTHVGRGLTADLRLDDHTVSARHAIVVSRPGSLRILDDRSTNGTVVNGRRVDEAELHDGDVVVLGRVVLTYRDLRAG